MAIWQSRMWDEPAYEFGVLKMLDKPALEGERVKLRAPKSGDADDRMRLGRDLEIVRMFGGSADDLVPLSTAEVEDWLAGISAAAHSWVIEHKGKCIGAARLHSFDHVNRRARYAIGILDPSLLGTGLGTETTRRVLAYAFEELGLHRVDLRVLAYNTRAIRSYEKCGFLCEGVERQSVQVDGEWHDDVIMSILEDEWCSGR